MNETENIDRTPAASGPSRRKVAQGVAWAAPVAAMAAAAPRLAASPATCECAVPVLGVVSTTVTKSPGSSSATVTIASGLTFSLVQCTGLLATGLITLRSAELTWASRTEGTSTYTTNLNITLGANAALIAAVPSALVFTGVTNATNGAYLGAVGLGGGPSYPVRLCLNISYTRVILGSRIECQQKICFTPSLVGATVGGLGPLTLNLVTFATAWGP